MKKILCSLLIVMMVACFMPTVAFAEDGAAPTPDPGSGTACETGTCGHPAAIGESHYDTLAFALGEAKSMTGDVTIELLTDMTLSGYESVDMSGAQCASLTIDGGNHTITGLAQPLEMNLGADLTVQNLTFKDVNITGNVSCGMTGAGVITAGTAIGQSVTINNVKIDGGAINSTDYAGGYIGYFQGGGVSDVLTVSNCEVKGLKLDSSTGGAIGAIVGQVNNATATITDTVIGENEMTAREDGGYRLDKTGIVFGTNFTSAVTIDVTITAPSKVGEDELKKIGGRVGYEASVVVAGGEYLDSPTNLTTEKNSLYSITVYGVEDVNEYADNVKVEGSKTTHTVTVDEPEMTMYVISGSNFTLPAAPTKADHTFKGWSDGTNTYNIGAAVTITADTAFTAQWEKIMVTPPEPPQQTPSSGGSYYNPVETQKILAGWELDRYVDMADYDAEEQAALQQMVKDQKALINKATSVNAVKEALAAAKVILDTVPTAAEKKAQAEAEAAAIEAAKEEVRSMKLTARSQMSELNGKTAVKVWWYNASGEELDLDGVYIYRSTKRYSGYGKKPFFQTSKDTYYNTAIKSGEKYYYYVIGYKVIDGETVLTPKSKKAWRTVKKA